MPERRADGGEKRLRVVLWGTCDMGKPRNRILSRALREAGVDLIECRRDVWRGVADKGASGGWASIAGGMLRSLLAYPALLWRYLRLAPHDVVLIGYLGHLDVLVMWPFARLRRTPIVWDAFLSLHETVVEDRAMLGRRNPLAGLPWLWDWLAARAAQLVVLDTRAHADWFAQRFGLKPDRVAAVFVGAEPEFFAAHLQQRVRAPGDPVRILFYGQFIPLHGIETIVEAAMRSDPARHRWILIGTGQEAPRIRRLLEERPVKNIEWIEWVPYDRLQAQIAAADVCLGIFGTSGKAERVIPNKAFQIVATGRPLMTRDSPAIRELVPDGAPGIRLVPAGNPDALLAAIDDLAAGNEQLPAALAATFSIEAIGRDMTALLRSVVARTGHDPSGDA